MQKELDDFITQLEAKQDLNTTLVDIQKYLIQLTGSPEKSTRKRINNTALDEFCELQNSFAYNLCGRLVRVIDSDPVQVLHCIQGVCLLHAPSRLVFNTNTNLQKLLDFCKTGDDTLQITAVNTFCALMVRQVEIIRRFESLKGLKIVTDIFKHKNTSFKVKRSILEFLFFYLVPETKYPKENRKSTAEKQLILGKYLSNVDGLVRELEVNKPFGQMDLDW